MFCHNCGSQIESSSKHCDNCGAQVIQQTTEKQTQTKKVNKNHFLILSLIGVLLILIAGSGYLFFVYIPNQQEKTAEEITQNVKDSEKAAQQQLSETQDQFQKFKDQTTKELASDSKQVSTQSDTSQPTISDVIKKWHPIIAYIDCQFRYTDGVLYEEGSGSGTLVFGKNGERSVLTNKHVVTDEDGYGPASCSVAFPGDQTLYNATRTNITVASDGSDTAYINISTPDSYLKNMTTAGRSYCSDTAGVGDEVVILGYPGIGSQTDITATDGIISGYDGNYYITSAKVEHGNSGGAAINVKDDCYLGIPTFVETGQVESLARILKWQAF